jgi:alanine-glyoxylate transaminase/serine-glyoxylate transaminase/serine-pyruvate transaminase
VSHLDPFFIDVMDDTVELLKYAFKTKNTITLPISGTGSAGMECALANLIEPGDEVIVGINGYFGERIREMVNRCGGQSIAVKAEWGDIITKDDVEAALTRSNAQIVAIVHAETSTGVLQPLGEIAKVTHRHDALLLVDAVTSLGGCELHVDDVGIDVCYSASQKCLNCPPGLAPITANERAMERVRNRKTDVQSWYLDLSLLEQYWVENHRRYHHTAPISLVYALREALRLLYAEELDKRWERHRRNSLALINGVEALELTMFAARRYRCPSLNAISVSPRVNDERVRSRLRDEFNITVSGGLGQLKGKLWRVGLMGMNASESSVNRFLESLSHVMLSEGHTATS